MYITHIPLCVPTIYMYKALNVDFLKCRSVHYFVIPLSIFFYIVLTNQKSNKTNLNWTWCWSVWRCNVKIVGPLRHSKSIFVHILDGTEIAKLRAVLLVTFEIILESLVKDVIKELLTGIRATYDLLDLQTEMLLSDFGMSHARIKGGGGGSVG